MLQNTSNLFGRNWVVSFDLWQLPVNSDCNRVDVSPKRINKETEQFSSCIFGRSRKVCENQSEIRTERKCETCV